MVDWYFRHNDDGSYTYGYEGADGSFKIETKLPTGEVSGKYGYVDDTGKLRVVDYGANRYGFQPAGEGITVAPPTLVDETTDKTKDHSFAEYDEEDVLFARPQQQTVARPVVRQPKRPRPVPVRPVQFDAQIQPQPQYVSYEATARAAAPVPTPLPVQHSVQAIQQAPAQFPQLPPQFQQQHQQQFHHQQPQQQPQPQPQQQHHHQQQFQQQQQFPQTFFAFEQPRHAAPGPRAAPSPVSAPSPVPSRAIVPGAVPSGPLFRPQGLSAQVQPSRPAPVREHHGRSTGSSGSVLDSLIQQYALPQGVGQPLHDISFGSYSSQTSF